MRVTTDFSQLPDFQRTVITIGSFDGVHTGHRRILDRVRVLAHSLRAESVAITFHPHPRTVLKPDDTQFKLITTNTERINLLASCGIDHTVVVPFDKAFSELSAKAYIEAFLVKQFKPVAIVIGYDHRFGHDRTGNIDLLRQYATEYGFEVVEIPAQEVDDMAVSSSKIRKALDESDCKLAHKLLEHPYTLTGVVVEGDRIGRTIGFPTANLRIDDPWKLILPDGIYAARCMGHSAMLYIGSRPSLNGQAEQRIEVNILDFDGDLYGKTITVEVFDFIRGDKKLDGLEALQAQIAADKAEIIHRLTTVSYRVSIVILNYNTRAHLAEYLPSVIENSPGARIIVADNGSPDDSVIYLKSHFPQVEILDLKQNWGFAEGYNQALKQVHDTDIYVILNSDVAVTAGWLTPVLDVMARRPEIAIAQPKILADRRRQFFEHAGAAGGWVDTLGYPFCRGRLFNQVEEDTGQYDDAQECFWAAGAAYFIRADLYHRFGGFDADYFAHNEEIDLCWRLKRAGYQVWCFPQSVVYHLGGGTLGYESPRKVYLNFRNSLFTLLKNESPAKLCWLIPARLVLDGVAGLLFAYKRQWSSIGAIIRAHFSFYGGFFATLKKRRAVNQLIQQNNIGPDNQAGTYWGSVVFAHYLRRVKSFAQLWHTN